MAAAENPEAAPPKSPRTLCLEKEKQVQDLLKEIADLKASADKSLAAVAAHEAEIKALEEHKVGRISPKAFSSLQRQAARLALDISRAEDDLAERRRAASAERGELESLNSSYDAAVAAAEAAARVEFRADLARARAEVEAAVGANRTMRAALEALTARIAAATAAR